MARLKSLNDTWKEYGGWVVLLFVGYILYSFRGVFTALGGAAGDAASAAVADAQANAQKKAQQTKVQAATGTKTKYSDAQLAQFEADARTLAGYLGQLPGLTNARLFKDQQDAFALIKQKYSRLRLVNNLPYVWNGGKAGDKNRPYKNVKVEVAACVKNDINYKVLAPFYKDITEGRDLVNDFRDYVNKSDYTKYFKWIL